MTVKASGKRANSVCAYCAAIERIGTSFAREGV